MDKLKQYGLIGLVAIAGILIGRYVIQPKTTVQTKEVVKYVEVFKEKKEEKKNVKTIIKEKTNVDGSKETTTEITDNTTTIDQTNRDTKLESEKTKVVTTGSGLTLSLLAIKDIPNPNKAIAYGAVISVPIFGRLNATGLVTTDKQVGLGLGLSF
jgi:hypothetical protein